MRDNEGYRSKGRGRREQSRRRREESRVDKERGSGGEGVSKKRGGREE